MKLSGKWLNRIYVALLLILVLVLTLVFVSGCVSGLRPIGWSGITITADNALFVGSSEGRLVKVQLGGTDLRIQHADALKPVAQTGFFGCSSPSGGGGCAGATTVAIYGSPVVSEELGFVYIAGYNGKIQAYDQENLGRRWAYPFDEYLEPVVGGLTLSGNTLIFGTTGGYVYALSAETGDLLWQFATGDKIWGTPTVSDDTVYIGSFDNKLYALDAGNGEKKWEFTTDGAIITRPLVYDGKVYFGSFDRNLYAVDTGNPERSWKFPGENWFWAAPIENDGKIYAANLDGKIYVLNAGNLDLIREIDLESGIASTPVIVGNYLAAITREGILYRVDTDSYEVTLLHGVDVEVDSPLTANDDIIYIHAPGLDIQRVNVMDGSILTTVSLRSGE